MGKRGPYAKGVARREEILARGLDVIADEGYAGASVHRIAAAAGLSKTGLLHHFDSKEQLLTEILRKRDEVDDPGLDQASTDLADLEAAYVRIVQRNAGIPGLVELFTRLAIEAADPAHPAHPFFSRRDRDLGERMARSIERAVDGSAELPASAEAMALILLAVTDGLQLRWLRDPEVDMAGTLTQLFELFERAMPGRAAGEPSAPDRPEIVCICGSSRFLDELRAAEGDLTVAGAIVLAPGGAEEAVTAEQKPALDLLHLRKIDLADRVLVVNPGGYIGESTSREIAYARAAGKPVAFTDPEAVTDPAGGQRQAP